jgi:hypothetical protein
MQKKHKRLTRRVHANADANVEFAVSKVHSFQGNVLARYLSPARYHCAHRRTVMENDPRRTHRATYIPEL